MANDQIYLEETHKNTVGMLKLLLFFRGVFVPYKKPILVTMILAFCVIGTELLLPQLLRIVLDQHITVFARKVSLTDDTDIHSESFIMFQQSLIPCGDERCFFILPEKFKKIQKRQVRLLEDTGILNSEKYYFTTVNPQKLAIVEKHEDLFNQADNYIFIQYNDLTVLDRNELMILRTDDMIGVAKVAGLFLVVLFCGFIFNFTQFYLVEFTSQKIMHDIRIKIFSHLQGRSLAFFSKNPVGRLVTRATNDVQNLHEMFNALFANILKDILILIGIMTILFWINWKLSLVCFATLPFLICCSAVFSVKSRAAFREVRIKIAAINSKIQENISGISVVKAFCREKLNEIQFQKLNHETYRANMKQTIVFAIFNPLVDLTRFSAIALIVWYGGGKTIKETFTIGMLVVFLYYMRMFFRPIQDLTEKYNIIQSAFASLERIYLLLKDMSVIEDPSQAKRPVTVTGRIEFRNVSFSYNENEPVLRDVSFSVQEGETVAIVGPTGAGKTTIINLLERYYDVQRGGIYINGIDIREMEKSFLRKQIGLVMQDVFLFAGTIRSNITLDNDSFSEQEIEKALEIANANKLFDRLPSGLDENVKEGGKTLSAGEGQLLSFARAILTKPKILILDEATSKIDPVTESLIQDALKKILKNRTSLIIAHRLSTIKKADRIIVLNKGRIYEEGTHDGLLRKQGLYFRLSQLQYMN